MAGNDTLVNLLQQLGFYQAGGKPQGMRDVDKLQQAFQTLGQGGQNLMTMSKEALQNKQLQQAQAPITDNMVNYGQTVAGRQNAIDTATAPGMPPLTDDQAKVAQSYLNPPQPTQRYSLADNQTPTLGQQAELTNINLKSAMVGNMPYVNPTTGEVSPTPMPGYYRMDASKAGNLAAKYQFHQTAPGSSPAQLEDMAQQLMKHQLVLSQLGNFGGGLKSKLTAYMSSNHPEFNMAQADIDFAAGKAQTANTVNFRTEDGKVATGNHGLAILKQGYDPQTGQYNVPPTMHYDMALTMARMLSPTGQIGEQMAEELRQKTLKEGLSGTAIYLGFDPEEVGGSTQSVIKMFKNNIERQMLVAQQNRDSYKPQGFQQSGVQPLRLDENNNLVPVGGSPAPVVTPTPTIKPTPKVAAPNQNLDSFLKSTPNLPMSVISKAKIAQGRGISDKLIIQSIQKDMGK